MDKLKRLLKENKFIYDIYNMAFGFVLNLCKLFIRVDNKTILFNCFGGKKFDDSPRAIYEYILSNSKYDDYKIYWAFDDINKYTLTRGFKLKNNSIKFFYIALKAKYWITNSSMERGLRFKNKKTFYINTWHGTTIKKLGKDQKSNAFCFKVTEPDIYFAQSTYDVDIFSSAFELDKKKIVLVGLPRNDELVKCLSMSNDCNEITDIRLKLKIPDGKKVILYMPTYREFDKDKDGNYIKPPIDINKWRQKLCNNYVLLFRAHYETTSVLGIRFDDFFYDVSDYEHLNDLLKIADILVSDYSSVMFDYSILERPIFSFAYDYDDYAQKRGCYIDITKELPNGICRTEDELLDEIINCNYEEQAVKTKRFKGKYIETCGNASEYIDSIIA